ncbi:conserved hypothetical protein [Burkholderia gladioli]|uniref:DUF262 domain-containing protein n=1 Tax=Burkholderia gladioli TaxID=28095 RepID=UPI001CB04A5E|nr:DUF262 domain-containing protein [Burkholderia gladioli]CAG9193314.1 conserved hypothetical protein [Burkholderia gladioli]
MLKVIPHDSKPLSWWYEQYLLGRINMTPAYQRRSYIWSAWKRAHLIDSLLNDFDVPKFYVANFVEMHVHALNKERKSYAIIDGKQRMQAIFDFFDGKLPLNPSFVLDDRPELVVANCTYADLKSRFPHLARKVEDFIPTVMDVLTDDEHKIEELFVRLNSGEAATGAEKRNAMGGPVPAIVRELVLHPFFQKKIRFDTKRMQEHNLATKLLLIEFRNGFQDTKAAKLNEFAEEGKRWVEEQPIDRLDLGPFGEARDRVYAVLDRLSPEFHEKDKLLSSAGQIPVYYWIARKNPELLPELRDFLEELTGAIKDLIAGEREQPGRADPELVSYYTMSRTTNDQSSLENRYRILVKRLTAYSKPVRGGRRMV